MSLTIEAAATGVPLRPVAWEGIAQWATESHADALSAFRRSCLEILTAGHGFRRETSFGGTREDWLPVCRESQGSVSPRSFFETNFTPLLVTDAERPEGLFTGYFEPEAEGSLTPGNGFDVPVYRKPEDLLAFDAKGEAATGLKYGRMIAGKAQAYFTRKQIEQGALQGRGLEIAWLRNWDDAFFIHIQGSGRIRLPDGKAIRMAYAAKTGRPYTAIGGVLVERGILTRATNSMQSIRAWMKGNPEAARALMWQNESFVFFRVIDVNDERLGALGAQQVNLTPGRSLAVDRSWWVFGTPIWLETTTPPESRGGERPIHRLMIAQDTGSAIKGLARGDVYWGWGEDAARIAGHMKSPGRMVVLLPNALAQRILSRP